MSNPVPLFGDNTAAQSWSTDIQSMRKAKHIEIRFHFIRRKVQDSTVIPKDIAFKENLSDGMTKPLDRVKFVSFRSMLGAQRITGLSHQEEC